MSYARFEANPLGLPTIEQLVGLGDPRETEWTKDTRVQTPPSVRSIPTAQAIVRASVKPIPRPEIPRKAVPTIVTRRRGRGIAWPIFLCGFIAGISGGTALATSPIAKTPAVQHFLHRLGSIVR